MYFGVLGLVLAEILAVLAVGRMVDRVAGVAQGLFQLARQIRIVLDHENAHGVSLPRPRLVTLLIPALADDGAGRRIDDEIDTPSAGRGPANAIGRPAVGAGFRERVQHAAGHAAADAGGQLPQRHGPAFAKALARRFLLPSRIGAERVAPRGGGLGLR